MGKFPTTKSGTSTIADATTTRRKEIRRGGNGSGQRKLSLITILRTIRTKKSPIRRP